MTLTQIANDRHNLRLRKLDISHSTKISDQLSVLLDKIFPSLTCLILSDCELNSEDLNSLVQANVEGRLLQLSYLDLSNNKEIILVGMFNKACPWNKLLKLNVEGTERILGNLQGKPVKQMG